MHLCNAKSEIVFIRHAPIKIPHKLFGFTDVEAKVIYKKDMVKIREKLSNINNFYSSTAVRCLQTFKSIWPTENHLYTDKRLWEQNFGDWEGLPFSQVPDLGDIKDTELANYQIPNGESFHQMCERIQPAILRIAKISLSKSSIVICHAGTVRAAIALALKSNYQALRFEINHLSITRLRAMENGQFSIISTNTNF